MIDWGQLLEEKKFTVAELSKATNINENRIAQILANNEPTLEELRKLASALKINLASLSQKSELQEEYDVLFRNSLKSKEELPSAAISDLAFKVSEISKLINANEARQQWRDVLQATGEGYEAAEKLARLFRNVFYGDDQLTPLSALPGIVSDAMGVVLLVVDSRDWDGASAIVDGQPYIFVSRRFKPRMLFTLAHELCHVLVHLRDKRNAWVDAELGVPGNSHQSEQFADAFAANLLLPSGGVATALRAIKKRAGTQSKPLADVEIMYLSRIFGVSFFVAAKRCEDLTLLPQGGAFALYEHVLKTYKSPEKFAQKIGAPDRVAIDFPIISGSLLNAVKESIWSGRISIGRAAQLVSAPITDIFEANKSLVH